MQKGTSALKNRQIERKRERERAKTQRLHEFEMRWVNLDGIMFKRFYWHESALLMMLYSVFYVFHVFTFYFQSCSLNAIHWSRVGWVYVSAVVHVFNIHMNVKRTAFDICIRNDGPNELIHKWRWQDMLWPSPLLHLFLTHFSFVKHLVFLFFIFFPPNMCGAFFTWSLYVRRHAPTILFNPKTKKGRQNEHEEKRHPWTQLILFVNFRRVHAIVFRIVAYH